MCIYHLTCINKVRAYIDEVKMLSSAKSKKENNFHLSKSLSMSNLAAEEEEGMGAHHRQPSSRE